MPRSRNVVASKARKKKIFKLAKGFLEGEKMCGELLKMQLKKHYNILTFTEKLKKEKLEVCGFKE